MISIVPICLELKYFLENRPIDSSSEICLAGVDDDRLGDDTSGMTNALDLDIEDLESRIAAYDEAISELHPNDSMVARWQTRRGTLVNQQAVLFAVKDGF